MATGAKAVVQGGGNELSMSEIVEPIVDNVSILLEAANSGNLNFGDPRVLTVIENLADTTNALVATALRYALDNPDPVVQEEVCNGVNHIAEVINSLVAAITALAANPSDNEAIEKFTEQAQQIGEALNGLVVAAESSTPDKLDVLITKVIAEVHGLSTASKNGQADKMVPIAKAFMEDSDQLNRLVELTANSTASEGLKKELEEVNFALKEVPLPLVAAAQAVVKATTDSAALSALDTAEKEAIVPLEKLRYIVKIRPEEEERKLAIDAQKTRMGVARVVAEGEKGTELDRGEVAFLVKYAAGAATDTGLDANIASEHTANIGRKKELLECREAVVKEGVPKLVQAVRLTVSAGDDEAKQAAAVEALHEAQKAILFALKDVPEPDDVVDEESTGRKCAEVLGPAATLNAQLADALEDLETDSQYKKPELAVDDAAGLGRAALAAAMIFEQSAGTTLDPVLQREYPKTAGVLRGEAVKVVTGATALKSSVEGQDVAGQKKSLGETAEAARKLTEQLQQYVPTMEPVGKTRRQREIEIREEEERKRREEERKRKEEEERRLKKEREERERKEREAREEAERIRKEKERQAELERLAGEARRKAEEEERKRREEEARKLREKREREERERKEREERERKEREAREREAERKRLEEKKRKEEEERRRKELEDLNRDLTTEETEALIRKLVAALNLPADMSRATKAAMRELMKATADKALAALQMVREVEKNLHLYSPEDQQRLLEACRNLRRACRNLILACKNAAEHPEDETAQRVLAEAQVTLDSEMNFLTDLLGDADLKRAMEAVPKPERMGKELEWVNGLPPLAEWRRGQPVTIELLKQAILASRYRIKAFVHTIEAAEKGRPTAVRGGRGARGARGARGPPSPTGRGGKGGPGSPGSPGSPTAGALPRVTAKEVSAATGMLAEMSREYCRSEEPELLIKKLFADSAGVVHDRTVQLKILSTVASGLGAGKKYEKKDLSQLTSCADGLKGGIVDVEEAARRTELRARIRHTVNQVIAMQKAAKKFKAVLGAKKSGGGTPKLTLGGGRSRLAGLTAGLSEDEKRELMK